MTTESMITIIALGTGATATVDIWALVRRRMLKQPLPDWALVGRWFAHLARGRVHHHSIAATTPAVRGELALGWISHYLVGIAFAALLPAIGGAEWIDRPTLWPAVALGVATVAAPFLVLQPGMGAGIAASRTPRPAAARINSLVTHAVYGLGLYVSAVALSALEGD